MTMKEGAEGGEDDNEETSGEMGGKRKDDNEGRSGERGGGQ